MAHNNDLFNTVVKKKQNRSTFDLSHDVKLSLDMGELVPITLIDVLPGDKISISTSQMLRMAPLVAPVMHKIDIFIEYFFVPNRILWGNWETFITGSKNGKQYADVDRPAFPILRPFQNTDFLNGNGTLADYYGLPSESDFPIGETPSDAIAISALPFAGYQRIWDEYYRDQNLMMSLYDVVEGQFENYNQLPDGMLGDGGINVEILQQLGAIRPRSWEHDYFTSALPFAQKGEQVSIPLNLAYDSGESTGGRNRTYLVDYPDKPGSVAPMATGDPLELGAQATSPNTFDAISYRGQAGGARWTVGVDNTEALTNATTINDLRAAIKLQEWLETNARGGSRYFESIYAHFGVKSPDSRLQRPEFIGSSRSNMIISEVLQTSSPQSETDTPQGNMSGHAQSTGSSKTFHYFAQEHGYIHGIMSLIPRTAYQQGIPKHFLKWDDKLDFYFPEFAHLGEQEIRNMEVYAGGSIGDSNGTFGYTPRYSEYKFISSRVCGDFRDTLKFWHMGRIFEDTPALNDMFIASNPTKRIFAVQDLPDDGDTGGSIRDFHSIYAHVFHNIKASRLMPKYGTPTI